MPANNSISSNNVTVKELIDILKQFDPEASVLVDQGLCRPPTVRAFNGSADVVLISATTASWVDPRR